MEPVPSSPVAPAAPKSSFGTASLLFALLTVVSPVAVALLTGYELTHNDEANKNGGWGWIGVVALGVMGAVVAAGVSALLGTLAGVVALVRGESGPWRPVFGLLVNGPVMMLVAYLIVAAQSGGSN